MLTLLLAAIGKKNRGLCRDYSITIKGAQHNFFVDEKDVQQLLLAATGEKIKGRLMVSFNLHKLERLLEENTWIRDAELYFDNRDILHVTVTEREPVARVFTTAGRSFYIDSSGRQMPLSEKLSARVPVFTGFPDRKVFMRKDSILLNDIRGAAQFILNDPFWMAQVAQVDIVPSCGHHCWHFEMVPVIGDHLVKLGNGENIQKKFHRLFLFYNQVLGKTGFNKYKVINVEYAGQVIALKEDSKTKVDSVQLRKNVEKLLRQSRSIFTDSARSEERRVGKECRCRWWP